MTEQEVCPECNEPFGPLDRLANGTIICSSCGATQYPPVEVIELDPLDDTIPRNRDVSPPVPVEVKPTAKKSSAIKPLHLVIASGTLAAILLCGLGASFLLRPSRNLPTEEIDPSASIAPQTPLPAVQLPVQDAGQAEPAVVQTASTVNHDEEETSDVTALNPADVPTSIGDAMVLLQWTRDRKTTHYTSGIIFEKDEKDGVGWIATANPDPGIYNGGGEVKIYHRLADGQYANSEGYLSSTMKETDGAVVVIRSKKPLNAINLVNQARLESGQRLRCYGFPPVTGQEPSTELQSPIEREFNSIELKRDLFQSPMEVSIDEQLVSSLIGGPVIDEAGSPVGIIVPNKDGKPNAKVLAAVRFSRFKSGLGKSFSAQTIRKFINGGEYRFEFGFESSNSSPSPVLTVFTREKQNPEVIGEAQYIGPAYNEPLLRIHMSNSKRNSFAAFELSDIHKDPLCQVHWEAYGVKHYSAVVSLSDALQRPFPYTAAQKCYKLIEVDPKAEFPTRLLPTKCFDFACSSKSSNILALSQSSDQAFLIPGGEEFRKPESQVKTFNCGSDPVAAIFKVWQEKEYCAIACRDPGVVHLLDAETLSPIGRVQTEAEFLSDLATSSDPKDPFLFYVGDGLLGAIDLRTSKDTRLPIAVGNTVDLSPDGLLLYGASRGSSPSGFGYWKRANSIDADKPTFVNGRSDREYKGEHIVDPLGRFVAAGNQLFSPKLEPILERQMKISPHAFFSNYAMMVGTFSDMRFHTEGVDTIVAASTETFELAKASVSGSRPSGHSSETVVSYLPNQQISPTEKRLVRTRIFADDRNAAVVRAFGNRIEQIPLSWFTKTEKDLIDRPYLLEQREHSLVVGKEATLSLKLVGSQEKVRVHEIPLHADVVEEGIRWTPVPIDVGKLRIPLSILTPKGPVKDAIEVEITQPYLPMPHQIDGLVVDQQGRFAVTWGGPLLDDNGRILNSHLPSTAKTSTISVQALKPGFRSSSIELDYVVKDAILFENKLFLQPAGAAQQVNVLNIESMKPMKALLSGSNLVSIQLSDSQIHLKCERTTDIYDLTSLRRIQSTNQGNSYHFGIPKPELVCGGVIVDGVLRKSLSGKPNLIIDSGDLIPIGKVERGLLKAEFLPKPEILPKIEKPASPHNVDSFGLRAMEPPLPRVHGQESTSDGQYHVALIVITNQHQAHEGPTSQKVVLRVFNDLGELESSIPIAHESVVQAHREIKSFLAVRDGHAYVGSQNRIYRVSLGTNKKNPKPQTKENHPPPLHLKPQQTEFVVRSEKTLLHHEAIGGKAPYKFELVNASEFLNQDADKGIVTLSKKATTIAALEVLKKIGENELKGKENAAALFEKALMEIPKSQGRMYFEKTGDRLQGIPFAIPIHVRVTDAQNSVAQMQYFVLIDVPMKSVLAALKK